MIAYITEINDNNYQEFTKNDLVLVDVWASWCGPCRAIAPIVDQISNEYHGKLSVGKMDADDNSAIIDGLGIRSIPTLLLYKDGEIVERIVGAVSKSKIVETIENYV